MRPHDLHRFAACIDRSIDSTGVAQLLFFG
jgi:hypothetical protein